MASASLLGWVALYWAEVNHCTDATNHWQLCSNELGTMVCLTITWYAYYAGINALGTSARYGWGAENVLQMRVTTVIFLSNFCLFAFCLLCFCLFAWHRSDQMSEARGSQDQKVTQCLQILKVGYKEIMRKVLCSFAWHPMWSLTPCRKSSVDLKFI